MIKAIAFALILAAAGHLGAEPVKVDLSKYKPEMGVKIQQQETAIVVTWNTFRGAPDDPAVLTISRDPNKPLLANIEIFNAQPGFLLSAHRDFPKPPPPVLRSLAADIDPQFVITTGSRRTQPGNRYTFFDNPATRATQRHVAKLDLKEIKVSTDSYGAVTITCSTLSAGPFSGDLLIHLYHGSPLIHIEAAMSQNQQDVAYIYDGLLTGRFRTIAWENLSLNMQRQEPKGEMTSQAVRLRTIMAEQENGTIALFPPPHSWFFPRDRTDNLKFAQLGAAGFGLRQDAAGGGAFVPWFDAPVGKTQRMDFFVLVSRENAEKTLTRVRKYTHDDSFKPLPGYLTFTSHYHSRLTVAEMAGKKEVTPEFARVMKGMGVNIVHLAEFHGDGNPDDPGPKRLPQMKTMFELCRKYSDERLLLIPGEEGNKYLGNPAPREHPGHWMYLFPRPVYLTWVRAEGQPFSEDVEGYGRVYHVGSKEDMVKLLEEEKGLAWTTHPRIKASYRTPDAFKDEPWYKSALWLGAAWKAMPADLSEDRLGRRCLDLLDDMQQWGQRKYLPVEVDVFEIDRTHELYGHMNINYLKMEKMPGPDDWSSVLDVLRRGEFFSTTGEILIESCKLSRNQIDIQVEATFPLAFIEVIWGDAKGVHREKVFDYITEEGGVGLKSPVELKDAIWARVEVCDVARNLAYTQPVTPLKD